MYKGFPWGTIVVRGTTYGAIDGLRGPSLAAILGPGGLSTAAKIAIHGPGTDFGGTIGWYDRPSVWH